jgi:hypothetical protein
VLERKAVAVLLGEVLCVLVLLLLLAREAMVLLCEAVGCLSDLEIATLMLLVVLAEAVLCVLVLMLLLALLTVVAGGDEFLLLLALLTVVAGGDEVLLLLALLTVVAGGDEFLSGVVRETSLLEPEDSGSMVGRWNAYGRYNDIWRGGGGVL